MAHERLTYPLVEVGRMLTETEPGGRLPAFAQVAKRGAGLTLVRYRVPWWSLHPIGLAVQGNYGVTKTWLSIFLVWAIKSILMRIGGDALYERGKSFFVGLLAAQALSTAIVFGVDLIWFPGNGHNVHNY